MGDFTDLLAYKKAFRLAMHIYQISKRFPREETFSLTDQIRRSSRSVCANLAEAFKRKRYRAYFESKLSDCDAENAETGVWLNFSLACNYITRSEYNDLLSENTEVGRLLGHILKYPEKYR